MIERIGNDGVLGGQQGLEHSAIGVESRRVQDGVLRVVEVGNGLLEEVLVDVLRATDEPDGTHAESALIDGALGGVHHPGMGAQAQVVVGAEIEHFAAVFQADDRVLDRRDHTFLLEEAIPFDGVELLAEMGFH